MSLKEGLTLTSNLNTISQTLVDGGTAFIPFSSIYAWFAMQNETDIDNLADIKGREEGKPFVQTFTPEDLSIYEEISCSISPDFLNRPENKDIFMNMVRISAELGHPIGILLPANPENNFKRNLGYIDTPDPITETVKRTPTVGFMSSGPDRNYAKIAKEYPILAGTSSNRSKDPRAKGSGHHLVLPLTKNFRSEKNTVLLVPEEKKDRHGPSTSVAFINEMGDAYPIRVGSVPLDELRGLLIQSGVRSIQEPTKEIRYIQPYAYNFPRVTRFLSNKFLHLMQRVTAERDITIR